MFRFFLDLLASANGKPKSQAATNSQQLCAQIQQIQKHIGHFIALLFRIKFPLIGQCWTEKILKQKQQKKE
jgi:hypothetical protein